MQYILGKIFPQLLDFVTTLKFPSGKFLLQEKIYFLETIILVNTVTTEVVIYQ